MEYGSFSNSQAQGQGGIAPQNLHIAPNRNDNRNSQSVNKVKIQPSNTQDVCRLAIGPRHQITPDAMPTARNLMDGSFHAAPRADIITIVPRMPDYCTEPILPSIVFSVNGKPGPYVHKFERVVIDSPETAVFESQGWKRTSLVIDWPGLPSDRQYISCTRNSSFYTRQDVAREVARRVISLLLTQKAAKSGGQAPQWRNTYWDIRNLDVRDIRLLGLNYYLGSWVPIFALDD